ncbi:MFS transporter [Saccharopolyspora taberi]|uniref:MFS transporter n=1 Tax=Saccharopolyspora taberi TaxID=60895 RepID=A0ABN3V264_9PSEU
MHSWGQAGIYTFMARSLPEEHRLPGNAVLSTIGAATTVIGPVLAAPIIAWSGAATVIALDAATFAVLAGTFLIGVAPVPPPPPAEQRGSGFAVVRRTPALLGLLSLTFCFFFLFGPVYVALPLHVSEEPGGSPELLAAFYTAFGAGSVAGGALAGHLRALPLWPTTVGIVGAFGVAMLPLGMDVPQAVALGGFALAGLLWPPYASLSTTLVQNSAAPAMLAEVLAASSSVRVLSVPLGTALAGPAIALLGASGTLRAAAIGILVLAAVAVVVRR